MAHNYVSYVYILGRHGYMLQVFYVVTLIIFFFYTARMHLLSFTVSKRQSSTCGFLYGLASGANMHSLFCLDALLERLPVAVVLSFPVE